MPSSNGIPKGLGRYSPYKFRCTKLMDLVNIYVLDGLGDYDKITFDPKVR